MLTSSIHILTLLEPLSPNHTLTVVLTHFSVVLYRPRGCHGLAWLLGCLFIW